MKMVQVSKQEEYFFLKRRENIFEIKEDGRRRRGYLKHKVKARDKNHLTNKKPKLDIMIQDIILIPWIETNQAKKH